jgi:hypothetical protein
MQIGSEKGNNVPINFSGKKLEIGIDESKDHYVVKLDEEIVFSVLLH